MFLLNYIIATVLFVSVYAIQYRVIVPEQPTSVSVLVDDVPYPLKANLSFPILYTGDAPIAKSEYRYLANIRESFHRKPTAMNTQNEFFNRSWNKYPSISLPQIYPELSSIHRIKSNLHRPDEIPTIHLIVDQQKVDAMHQDANDSSVLSTTMSYFSNDDTFLFPKTEFSLAGRTSRKLAKKSYNLKLKSDLYGYRRLKLRSLGTDPSYIREKISHSMTKAVGLATSGFSYVRLVINNQPIGLFGLIDTFQGKWLSNMFENGQQDYHRGYLYEGTRHTDASEALGLRSDLSYNENITAYSAGQYKIKVKGTAKKKGFKPLQKLTLFIESASENTRVWNRRLDTESVLRSMALEVLLGFGYGYLTMCDNFYLYQNPKTKKFIYIPSDMDFSLGNSFFKLDDMWSGDYRSLPAINTRPLFTKMMGIPAFKARFEFLIQDINKKLIDPAVTFSYYKRIADMIEEDVTWDKSLPRVGESYYSKMARKLILSRNSNIYVPDNADLNTYLDMGLRLDESVSFKSAIDGPTGHISLPSIKDWFFTVYRNTIKFYSQKNRSSH